MNKVLPTVLLLTLLLIAGTFPAKDNDVKWNVYKERINTGCTLSFLHPENLPVHRLENGLCVSSQTTESKIITQGWCIWMEDAQSFDEAREVSHYQTLLKEGAKVERRPIRIGGNPALRIIFADKRGTCYDNVYFSAFGTHCSVLHQRRASPAYEKFLNSIAVYKETKK
ncbi:MAG: hypothetical protein ICV83_31200 [Cytophagales bacterium]|nr:hypothetical protein [Cytophagales bacterium]